MKKIGDELVERSKNSVHCNASTKKTSSRSGTILEDSFIKNQIYSIAAVILLTAFIRASTITVNFYLCLVVQNQLQSDSEQKKKRW